MDRPNDLDKRLEEYESVISGHLPKEYCLTLLHYGATILFKKRVCYLPEKSTPFDKPNGMLNLEALYGLEQSDDSLVSMYCCYKDRLPKFIIPIGAAPGGNQICLDLRKSKSSSIYLWDHEQERVINGQEENDFANMYKTFKCLNAFFNALVIEEEEDEGELGVVESESWLDF